MSETEGEFKKRLGVILTDDDLVGKTIEEAHQEFIEAWGKTCVGYTCDLEHLRKCIET